MFLLFLSKWCFKVDHFFQNVNLSLLLRIGISEDDVYQNGKNTEAETNKKSLSL